MTTIHCNLPDQLIFVDDAHTFGGAQIALANCIKALLQHNSETRIICVCTVYTQRAIDQIVGPQKRLTFVECPPAMPMNMFLFLLRMPRFFRILVPLLRQPNCQWWFNLSGIEFCLAPLIVLRVFGIGPIAWLHNPLPLKRYHASAPWHRRLLYWTRDYIANIFVFSLYRAVISPSHAAELEQRSRISTRKAQTTGFLYPLVEEPLTQLQPDLSIKQTPSLSLWMIGRVEYAQKNNLICLQVLANLLSSGHSASLTVIGDGPDLEHFRQSASKLGLMPWIVFKQWESDPWRNVPKDALVLIPSIFESFCLVAREAMLRNIRIVVSPLPVFYEWIPNRLIAEACTAEAFAQKIISVAQIGNEQLLELYNDAGNELSAERFVARFEQLTTLGLHTGTNNDL